MTATAPKKLSWVDDPDGNQSQVGLVFTDANGSIANVTTPWYLNASGIYIPHPVDANGNPQMSLAGSNATEEHDVIVELVQGTTYVQSFNFSTTTKNLSIINDGTTDIRCCPNGTVAQEANENNAMFTYSGTGWTGTQSYAAASYGTYNQSPTANDYVTINPGVSVESLGLVGILNNVSAIVDFELSTDGTTWANPSTFAGMVREDGATGTNMDTFDAYTATTPSLPYSIVFRMPFAANWQLRVTNSGTKNASSGGTYILIDGAIYELPNVPLTVKAGETFTRSFQASSISYRAVSGSPSVRFVGDH